MGDWKQELIALLATILSGAAVITARAIGQYFQAKMKIAQAEHLDEQLGKIAAQAIHAAEQWAIAKVKNPDDPTSRMPSGNERLDKALEFALAVAKEKNLGAVARDALVRAIEAKLGEFNWYADRPSGEAP